MQVAKSIGVKRGEIMPPVTDPASTASVQTNPTLGSFVSSSLTNDGGGPRSQMKLVRASID
jgi:hypothetical protein